MHVGTVGTSKVRIELVFKILSCKFVDLAENLGNLFSGTIRFTVENSIIGPCPDCCMNVNPTWTFCLGLNVSFGHCHVSTTSGMGYARLPGSNTYSQAFWWESLVSLR